MKYFLYIFYRYYKSGRYESIPYFSALCAVAFPLIFYLTSIYVLIFPEVSDEAVGICLVSLFIVMVVVTLFLSLFTKENSLPNHEFQKRYRKFHGFFAVLYIAGSLVIMGFSALYREKQQENALKEFVKSQQERMQPLIDKYRREHPGSDAEIIIADDSIIDVNPIP